MAELLNSSSGGNDAATLKPAAVDPLSLSSYNHVLCTRAAAQAGTAAKEHDRCGAFSWELSDACAANTSHLHEESISEILADVDKGDKHPSH